jgi:translation elongation factor EF-Tu-like GTPase
MAVAPLTQPLPDQNPMSRPRFDAVITFLHPDEGGRQMPPQPPFTNPEQSYLPHVVVDGDSTYLGVRFIGGPAIEAGGSGRFSFIPAYPDVDYSAVQCGTRFTVREGGNIVGHGVVMHVLPLGWPRDGDSHCTAQDGG